MARKSIYFSAFIMSFVLGPVGLCQVWADSLIVKTDNSDLKTYTRDLDINVTGNEMVGMEITVFFSDKTIQTGTWEDLGGTLGGIKTDWTLVQAGATKLNTPWTLTNNSGVGIVGFSIDAISGNTVFDIVADPKVTEASGFGSLLTLLSADAGLEVSATFSQPVGLEGGTLCSDSTTKDFCGDLFGTLKIEFLNDGQLVGMEPNNKFAFSVDTDQFEFPLPSIMDPTDPGSKDPTDAAPIPEPNSLFLFGTGLVGLLGARKFLSLTHSSS